jgi:hypothetical protein
VKFVEDKWGSVLALIAFIQMNKYLRKDSSSSFIPIHYNPFQQPSPITKYLQKTPAHPHFSYHFATSSQQVNFTGPGIVYACATKQISTRYHAQAIVSHTFIRIHRNPGITRLIRARKCHKPRWYRTSATSDFDLMTSLFIISIPLPLNTSLHSEKMGIKDVLQQRTG